MEIGKGKILIDNVEFRERLQKSKYLSSQKL
jgi:hypothetical protein